MTGQADRITNGHQAQKRPADVNACRRDANLQSGERVRVMVSKVADILLVAEVNAEGHRVIRLPFLASGCNRTPRKMIPAGTDAHLRRNSGTIRHRRRM